MRTCVSGTRVQVSNASLEAGHPGIQAPSRHAGKAKRRPRELPQQEGRPRAGFVPSPPGQPSLPPPRRPRLPCPPPAGFEVRLGTTLVTVLVDGIFALGMSLVIYRSSHSREAFSHELSAARFSNLDNKPQNVPCILNSSSRYHRRGKPEAVARVGGKTIRE